MEGMEGEYRRIKFNGVQILEEEETEEERKEGD